MVERSFTGTLWRFTALGVPVRVEGSFLVTSLVLGAPLLHQLDQFVAWTAIVFVSILVHELGHALVGRRFGLVPDVRLYAWGGLTSWTAGPAPTRPRRLAISLAGPAVGLVIGAAAWLALRRVPEDSLQLKRVLDQIVFANGIWGLVNLAPVLPLDGGNAFAAVLGMVAPAREEQGSRLVSAVTGIGLGVIALANGWSMAGVFAIWLGIDGAKRFVASLQHEKDEALIARLQPIFTAALDREDGAALVAAAEPALRGARTDRARAWLVENLALGHALAGALDEAVAALGRAPAAQPASTQVEGFVLWKVVAQRKRDAAVAAGIDPAVVEGAVPSRDESGSLPWKIASELLRDEAEVELDAVRFGRVREAGEILGRDRDAARLGEILFDRAPDPDLAFAVCCAWARAREATIAAVFAEKAIELGFRDFDRADAAPELALADGREAKRAFDRARA
jgi:Zn-dependent protease